MEFIVKNNSENFRLSLSQEVDLLRQYPNAKKFVVNIQPYRSKRTLLENNYFHKICQMLSELTGYGMEYFKAFNKKVFFKELPGVEVLIDKQIIEGEEIAIRKLYIDGEEKEYSSTSLPADLFYLWLELIREFWNSKFNNFYIQTPEEYFNSLEK